MTTTPRKRQPLDAFIARNADFDAMLERLTELGDDHFNVPPDEVTWEALERLDPLWDEHFPAEQARIDPERLIAGPDCGMTMLPRDTARAKLQVLSQAAKSVA